MQLHCQNCWVRGKAMAGAIFQAFESTGKEVIERIVELGSYC